MVRDGPDTAAVPSPQQNRQSPRPPPDGPPAAAHPPQQAQPDVLPWDKISFEEEAEPDTWRQPASGSDGDSLPTHLRPFSDRAEYELVRSTYRQLQHGGYYWGPMNMEEAHQVLSGAPPGTFLIRDSGQPDVFFTLSYQSKDGPTSVRVQLHGLLFSLHGSRRTFASLFALLAYYTGSSCKLTLPHRRQRPESLKQTCRRAFVRTYGAENIFASPGLSPQVKNYVCAYPHSI